MTTTRIHREPKTARCSCGQAGSDWGELEEHVISSGTSDHWPVDPAHVTDRIREAQQQAARSEQVREAVAQSAGVSVDELREALR